MAVNEFFASQILFETSGLAGKVPHAQTLALPCLLALQRDDSLLRETVRRTAFSTMELEPDVRLIRFSRLCTPLYDVRCNQALNQLAEKGFVSLPNSKKVEITPAGHEALERAVDSEFVAEADGTLRLSDSCSPTTENLDNASFALFGTIPDNDAEAFALAPSAAEEEQTVSNEVPEFDTSRSVTNLPSRPWWLYTLIALAVIILLAIFVPKIANSSYEGENGPSSHGSDPSSASTTDNSAYLLIKVDSPSWDDVYGDVIVCVSGIGSSADARYFQMRPGTDYAIELGAGTYSAAIVAASTTGASIPYAPTEDKKTVTIKTGENATVVLGLS